MDFVKVFDQTVREIKREVNLKVLKIPEIEQKVLDVTSDEPWGPHGSALSEIAQATKKITEFQMIMNVLWTRLSDTGAKWRHVYKALAVIEYLVANGSERALDDILDRSHRIAAISDFQYIEPNGKDVGINVRKKVETILALLHDKEKIQEVRNKAAANRDKYFGLSSTGITYKSSSASHGGSNFNQNDRYGGLSCGKDGSFKDAYRDRERSGGEMERKHEKRDSYNKSPETFSKENEENKSKKGVRLQSRNQDSLPSVTPKPLPKPGSSLSATSSAQPSPIEDDFDDFDPRGSSTAGSANASFNQVDLFGQNIVGDLMDAPAPVSTEKTTLDSAGTPELDLFANATFVSASPHVEETSSQTQGNIGLFANQPANPAAFSSNMDFFAPPDPGLPSETKSSISEPTNTKNFDPFASMPLNTFDESDMFGAFTSHTNPPAMESPQSSAENCLNNLDDSSSSTSKPAAKKDTFQVKSGIWADSLSRGLIDLNITAPKKTSLADIGIVMGLGDGLDDKEKGPLTSMYMGRAMRPGSGLGMSGFASSTATMGNEGFSALGQQQFGSFK